MVPMFWFRESAELDEEFANQAKVSTTRSDNITVIQLLCSFYRFTVRHHAARHGCVHSIRFCRIRHYFAAGWRNFNSQKFMEWLHTILQ